MPPPGTSSLDTARSGSFAGCQILRAVVGLGTRARCDETRFLDGVSSLLRQDLVWVRGWRGEAGAARWLYVCAEIGGRFLTSMAGLYSMPCRVSPRSERRRENQEGRLTWMGD